VFHGTSAHYVRNNAPGSHSLYPPEPCCLPEKLISTSAEHFGPSGTVTHDRQHEANKLANRPHRQVHALLSVLEKYEGVDRGKMDPINKSSQILKNVIDI